jgi:hypothetical protein
MMLKKYLELEVLVFVLAGALVGYFLLSHHNSNQQTLIQAMQSSPEQPAPQVIATNPTTTPVPTVTPAAVVQQISKPAKPTLVFTPAISTTSQISPDGTRKVSIDIVGNQDGSKTYEVLVDNSPVIFSKTLPTGESISIPYNTWSPDNTYFFLQENSGNQTQIMVFNASGQPFTNGNEFLDLTGVFAQDVSASAFGQATGWASDNLIIIESKNADRSNGTSYWFGVPGESVTPLATQF